MPIVGTEKLDVPPALSSDIARWVLWYGRGNVGYQSVDGKPFVYKVPTIGQLLDLEVAEAQDPMAATKAFLLRISLSTIPRVRPHAIMELMGTLVKEHFPAGEDGLKNDLLKFTHSHTTTMIGAIDTHLASMDADSISRDMTYSEVLERLAIKQIVTQQPIMEGSMPKRTKRGINVKKQGTQRSGT